MKTSASDSDQDSSLTRPSTFAKATADKPGTLSHPMGEGHGCCADTFKSGAVAGSVAESQEAFGAMLQSVQAAGVLTEKAKELILFSLVVQSRCHPCFDAHYAKAREMGIAQAELDEAAWCAIAMGGAPVKMFYQESLDRIRQGTA